ncbi:MAG: tetratricopeptide repeat protein [Bacteroidia bacterium]
MKKLLVLTILASLLYGCQLIVKMTDSKKSKGEFVSTEIAQSSNQYFWDHFHQGNYDSIPKIINRLNLALSDNPKDVVSTAHLGFVHVWALSERQRLEEPRADITEHAFLSRRYFAEAYKMNPHDPRILGFLADLTLAEGNISEDQQTVVDGYFKGLKSIRQWPQFNKFSIGYIFSILDTTDKNFAKALEWQYETLDDCACQKIDRQGDYVAAIRKIKNNKDPKIARACWNSWIAPHNWEGFCLNFGDMLTKKGTLAEAKKIYQLARLSDTYASWPYKSVLEARIEKLASNYPQFNQPLDELNLNQQKVVLFNSRYSCVSCHQMSSQDLQRYDRLALPPVSYYNF